MRAPIPAIDYKTLMQDDRIHASLAAEPLPNLSFLI